MRRIFSLLSFLLHDSWKGRIHSSHALPWCILDLVRCQDIHPGESGREIDKREKRKTEMQLNRKVMNKLIC